MYNLKRLIIMKLPGIKVLEEINSPINGKLEVVRDIFFGTYIKGGGLPQSGGLALKIWIKPLKKVKKLKPEIENILILGLGGGGIVKKIRSFWPDGKITGVEIDPIMVSLGKKYLDFKESDIDIKITDANRFINSAIKKKQKYDLVLVDIYVKDQVPKEFDTTEFANEIKSILTKKGIAVFNRLYGGRKEEASEFHNKLQQVFPEIKRVFPEANIMFVCSNN